LRRRRCLQRPGDLLFLGHSESLFKVSNDYTLIGRLLDEGAMGIIVPLVHTPDDAQRAADACRLPPVWGLIPSLRFSVFT